MSRRKKLLAYFGLRDSSGGNQPSMRLLSWRFLVECLTALALMLAVGAFLRAVGVGHEPASYIGIAAGASVGGLITPLWSSRSERQRRR